MAHKENTGFRNGDMFCFNCGDSHKLVLPMDAGKAAQIMIDFGKRHKKCPKTWEEPKIEDAGKNMSVAEKGKWWVLNGERGISSETMYAAMSGDMIRRIDKYSHPSDPDDFRRCYLLLKAVPEFKERISILKSISPTWSSLVDNWDKLTEMLEDMMKTKKGNGMYKFMKSPGC